MVRIKLVMDKRRKLKSECFPLKLKFTVQQKVWFKNIGINLKPKFWNINSSQLKRNCPNWNIINLHLQQVLVQHLKEVIECSICKPNICLTDIQDFYKPNKEPVQDFFTFAETMYLHK